MVRRLGLTMILAGIAGACIAPSVANATIIFQDDFSGLVTTDLNGLAPDTTPGATWVAAPFFKANGSFNGTGSATLAFNPANGNVYTLDISFEAVTGGSWVAFGFANGQGTVASTLYRFTTENGNQIVEGRAWGLIRTTGDANNNVTFLQGSQGAAAAASNWASLTTQDAPLDVRVVLDTTDPLDWTTTMFARTGTDPYSVIRAETSLVNTSINSVGFSSSGSTSTVTNFTLVAVPEPGSIVLLACGGLFLALRRRRS